MSDSVASGLQVLDDRKPRYRRPLDPVVEEVLVPALQTADEFRCMVGYFGAGALRELAHGLAAYIHRSQEPLRLLVSPVISEADQQAIEQGLATVDDTASASLESVFDDEATLADALALHTKRCLAHLIRSGRLEMKVVVVRKAKFHLKEWIFLRGPDVVVLSGSANFTGEALGNNVETLHLHRSWRGGDSAIACRESLQSFDDYWCNRLPHAVAVDLPAAVRARILRDDDYEGPPTEHEYRQALRAEGLDVVHPDAAANPTRPRPRGIVLPDGLVYDSGPYAHQGEAVVAWERADRHGILEIATGGGKTISALVAAWRLWRETRRLLLVVAAPTHPLVLQWISEVQRFGLTSPIRPHQSRAKKLAAAESAIHNLELGLSTAEALVVTLDLLCDPEFRKVLESHSTPTMLVADEVHNFGTGRFLVDPPEWVPYRLGLSATPTRQYDEPGTESLFEFFGKPVYEFGLDRAIGVCLVPYDYYVHPVSLTEDELAAWQDLTSRIRRLVASSNGAPDADDEQRLERLLIRRRRILELAAGKVGELERLLGERGPANVAHTLVYATDKDPTQLQEVNELLRRLGIRFHRVTAEETPDERLIEDTLAAFRSGVIAALSAKRVLDEGLNVPEIRTAYLLASTTVTRQWVQRRGRVLRQAPGKTHAVIHDFLVLPPSEEHVDDDTRNLVRGELERCNEFARLARNRFAAGGPEDTLSSVRMSFVF